MNEGLSSYQVEALHAVELRLGWVNHGLASPELLARENGPAVIGVIDKDYGVVDTVMSGTTSGDVCARERIFGGGGLDPETPPDTAYVVQDIGSALFRSPYVTQNPFQAIPGAFTANMRYLAGNSDPLAVRNRPDLAYALTQGIDIGRQLHIIDTFEYADGLAALRGVTRMIADSSFRKQRRGEARDVNVRNADMVQGLGDIAVAIAESGVQPDGRKPILSFVAGRGHAAAEKLLVRQGVPFSSQVVRRPFAEAFVGNAPWSNPEYAIPKYFIKQWFKNLRAHGHTPLNATLRRPVRGR
jgi:hypothetical protein